MTARRAIVFLAFGQTVFWAGLYYIFAALLVQWEMAEPWSKTAITASFTGAIIMSAICAPFSGRLIDRGLGPYVMSGAAFLAVRQFRLDVRGDLARHRYVLGRMFVRDLLLADYPDTRRQRAPRYYLGDVGRRSCRHTVFSAQ